MKRFEKISVADHEKAMERLKKRMESVFKTELEMKLNDRDEVWRIEIEKNGLPQQWLSLGLFGKKAILENQQ